MCVEVDDAAQGPGRSTGKCHRAACFTCCILYQMMGGVRMTEKAWIIFKNSKIETAVNYKLTSTQFLFFTCYNLITSRLNLI